MLEKNFKFVFIYLLLKSLFGIKKENNIFFDMNDHRIFNCFTLRSKSWKYRGEGNANLVLALTNNNKIIRFQKFSSNEKKKEEKIWFQVDFCREVMQPLLGKSFVNVPDIVFISDSEINELNKFIHPFRDVKRLNKEIGSNYATISHDLCFFSNTSSSFNPNPTFCVEIKPKQGWIPISERYFKKCTFCLNQYLKLKQGTVKSKTQYCPLDLFSGNHNRMKFAIRSLLECPQNNMKIFKNENLILDDTNSKNYKTILEDWFGANEEEKLIENFTSVITHALLSEFDDLKWKANSDDVDEEKLSHSRISQNLIDEINSIFFNTSLCYDKKYEKLPENCVLNRILNVQKLDELGCDKINQLYDSHPHEDDYDYLHDLLSNPKNISKHIIRYLLATTVKDCSIMIVFQKSPRENTTSLYQNTIKDLNDSKYIFQIGISDLDPKPASCIVKHKKRNNDVINSCIEYYKKKRK